MQFAGAADFCKARFDDEADFSEVYFTGKAHFVEAEFGATARFDRSTFDAVTEFTSAQFLGEATFFDAHFTTAADFQAARFDGVVEFRGVQFTDRADFREAQLSDAAGFVGASFSGVADFSSAAFSGESYFQGTRYGQLANFRGAQFAGKTNFRQAVCATEADYTEAKFGNHADFSQLSCNRKASLRSTTFSQMVDFKQASFGEGADFSGSSFVREAEFCGMIIGPRRENRNATGPQAKLPPAIADFTGVRFELPTTVRFFQVNKDSPQGLRVRFTRCELQDVQFEDVHWHREGGRLVLQDELDLRGRPAGQAGSGTSYEPVAVAYRRLANNLTKTRTYDLADSCWFGAMEMKRLDPTQPSLLRWMAALYRWASCYGISYKRAFLVLVLLLVLFGLVLSLPWAGLQPRYADGEQALLTFPKSMKAGLIHSLEVASFWGDPLYVSTTWFGRLAAFGERILVTAQFVLVLLALRRRFRI